MNNTDWRKDCFNLWQQGKSWNEITEIIQGGYFNNEPFPAIRERVRGYIRSTPEYKQANSKPTIAQQNRPVGVFSDPHIPFDHPGYLPFLIDTFKQYNVGQIICLGDLVDFHALSRFMKETCAYSSKEELRLFRLRVEKYYKAFPDVDFVPGNHDIRYILRAKEQGIDEEFLKPLDELLKFPKGWKIHDEEFISGNVLYKHGINCLGKDGALNTAIQERMSTVIGHSHSFGGCKYSANKRSIIFGLNTGCGISVQEYAFAYGKHDKYRPTLGCGIVYSDSHAVFVPMGAKYFRN